MADAGRLSTRFALLAGIGLFVLFGCDQGAVVSEAPKSPGVVSGAALAPLPNISALVKKDGPAVVSISSTRKIPGRRGRQGMPEVAPDNPLFDLFRHFGLDGIPSQEYFNQSLGSGFIIDREGYILTNAHVVANADEVKVGLTDKREFTAKLIGLDSRTDVAVVKISAGNLPFVTIGDPSKLEVGEWVVAIGTPFGFANSVTQGIVSAKGRILPGETVVPFIQTDAAINPGSSGGPLFNLNGEVVGINSQIYSQSGGYMGLSFAIPIDVAIRVKDQLLKHGTVRRGRLGVTVQEVSQELAESFGLEKAVGALVSSVEKGGPAERAGLQAGDIVLRIDGRALTNSLELASAVSEMAPGTSVRLSIWRNGTAQEIVATLANADAEPSPAKAKPGIANPDRLGLSLRELSPAEQRAQNAEGRILVEAVDGIAAMSGVQPGDIILALNNKPVTNLEQLRSELKTSGKRIALLLQRDENTRIFISLNIPDR